MPCPNRGCNSVVEYLVANEVVVGSSPITRFTKEKGKRIFFNSFNKEKGIKNEKVGSDFLFL